MSWQPTVQKQLTQAEAYQLTRLLADAVLLLDAAKVDMPRLVPALRDAANGIGSSFSSGGVSGGERSDPTFSAVLARMQGGSDKAGLASAEVSAGVREVHRLAVLLHGIIHNNLDSPTPLPPKCRDGACPSGSPPRSASGGRCDACRKHWERTGEERASVRGSTDQAA